ncbi:phosphatidic acid phosphatase [Rhizobacter sp. Root1221]|nr:phosphatidic acid phosphatase [Rhizobacter sp. Root1221]
MALATLFVSVCLFLWEVSGRDMAWAHTFGNEHGFPWRDHWLFSEVLHEGGRRLSWAFALFLCLGVWWPVGVLRRIGLSHRLQLAATAMVASGVVVAIKSGSGSSCPWDMQAFGGVAHFVPHWRLWGLPDGGSGHCFPAGHASAGFAFVGGWFVFRAWPRVAAVWLASAVGAGLVFGVAQQVRGAHFMSHTLWTGWICWVVAWAIDAVWPRVATEVLA